MLRTKQRGSGRVIRLALWFYKVFGYFPFFILLYPITFIYYVKAANVRRALKLYYRQIGVKYTRLRYFEHLRKFAIVMTDRFISKCDPQSYNIIINKQEAIKHTQDGAIMLFSHFGGWSVTAEFLRETNLHVTVIMKEIIKSDIKAVEAKLCSNTTNVKVVDLMNTSVIDASVIIAKALLNKEIVAMMGDRANNPKHAIKTEFFGREAEFNKTPFEIAKKSKLPIIVFFSTYIKPRVYKADFFKIDSEDNIESMLRQYTKAYEDVVKKVPNQWFNLYNFWEES
ncbi:MAG: lysophospholipid acyltransferase family protein [Campylobacteraceae bacterium]|nr:lysophospholipid acyltransferase family protein [Campylobacteraceae bacterium]